ncbi:hypothetical protein BN863_650 [Formosa agariphila KMM 3901]|uniref:Collagen triple helix repeat protein n=1 Tax=Formosa agariphila (strain DSM 15362 / KCTC 12365 / LMG 23005 / KMM 3901 / M-2Alg 35-1) TaxID=1347342 RepID=T2KGA9_FORAG|nr:hypothetical protein BN863_650 [Formosa agariphila KMM 3901]
MREFDGTDGNNGTNGADGAAGADGVGIDSTTDNGDGTFTISYTDGTSFTTPDFTGPQGAQGIAGTDGANGADGATGADGVGIDSTTDNGDGTFTISYTDGTSFTTPDFTGPQGAQGIAGTDGTNGTNGAAGADGVGIDSTTDNGDGTFTISYTDGTSFTTPDFTGPQGAQGIAGTDGTNGTNGAAGADGVGIDSTTDNGDGTFTILYTDGTSFTTPDFTGPQGAQGIAGTDGTDGTNGADGAAGADGVGIDSTTNNGDGTFTISYTDGTSFTTPDFTGPQGAQGIQGLAGPAGPQGPAGTDGVVNPEDLTAGDTSITVTNGTGATLVDANVKVTDGGITTIKLADGAVATAKIEDGAVTAPKLSAGAGDNGRVGVADDLGAITYQNIDDLIDEPWRNTDDTPATDSSTNINYMGGDIGIGTNDPTERLDIGTGNLRVRDINTLAGVSTDKIVVADTDGVLKTVDNIAPKFFYMPAVIFETTTTGAGLSRNLYEDYNKQFTGQQFDVAHGATGSSMTYKGGLVGSTGAPTAMDVYADTELYYYISYYDQSVFANVSISDSGVLTYDIISSATPTAYMNIIFVIK